MQPTSFGKLAHSRINEDMLLLCLLWDRRKQIPDSPKHVEQKTAKQQLKTRLAESKEKTTSGSEPVTPELVRTLNWSLAERYPSLGSAVSIKKDFMAPRCITMGATCTAYPRSSKVLANDQIIEWATLTLA